MSSEFYVRKGLSIATASVATASGATQATKYLVLGDDSIVRWATASTGQSSPSTAGTSGTSGISGSAGNPGTSGTSGVNGGPGTSGTSGVDGGPGTSGTSGLNGTSGTTFGTSGTSGTSGLNGTSGTTFGTSGTSGTRGTSGTSGINGTSGTSGISGTSGTSGINGTSGTSGTSGTRGTSGTTGTSGTSGTRGTSGTSGISGTSGLTTQNIIYQYDITNAQNVISPDPGAFTYWDEGSSSSISTQAALPNVQYLVIKKSDINNKDCEQFFLSFNGTGTTKTWTENSVTTTYTTSLDITKGYLRIRSTSDNTYNVFKVVAKGYYNGGGGGPVDPLFSATTTSTGDYYLSVIDAELNNLMEIYVVYVGSTTQDCPVDSEQCLLEFSLTLSGIYNQAIVSDPKYSFQINDGQTPPNLDSFGLAQNFKNSIYLNNTTSKIAGATGGSDNSIFGYNAGITMSTATAITFIGASAGSDHKTGYSNTFLGAYSGTKNISGNSNVFIGVSSGASSSVASRNIYIGNESGYGVIGVDNVFLGHWSGRYNLNGNRNTFIGTLAGTGSSNISNSIAIGYGAAPSASNQLVLASAQYPLGTSSVVPTFTNTFLNVKINGMDMKIPLYI